MLSGLKNIFKDNGSSVKEVYLEVNPYLHSSRKALQLIAGLNQPTSLDFKESNEFNNLDNVIYSSDFEKECNTVFKDYRYTLGIKEEYELMKTDVNSSHDEDWTKIVLGGEFSAGKSSFLNSLLCDKGEIEFLPVSEKPTSVIPTYIYCSDKQKIQYVIGENKQNGKMLLTLHALLALGHDFERKHHISLGTFLNKLIIQQPIKQDFLKDVAFVDTPGYSKEDGQSIRDKQTAINAVKSGEVLFWLIDIEAGTIKKEDLDFISDNFENEKPKVIIFNKADKKTSEQISEIILNAEIVLKAKNDNTIVDIVAYSSHERKILGSCKGNKDWKSIFEKVKSSGRKKKAEQDFMDLLKDFLEVIIDQTASKIKELDNAIRDCNRLIVEKNDEEDYDNSYIKAQINRYYNKSIELKELCNRYRDVAKSSLQRELGWEKKLGFFESAQDLMNLRNIDFKTYNSFTKKDIEVLDIEEGIFEHLDYIQKYINKGFKKDVIETQKKLRDNYRKEIDDLNGSLKKFNKMVNLIELQLRKSIKELNEKKAESNFENLSIVGVVNSKGDIFNCIINNDFDGFLDCLSKKTEISNLKNNDGHDILSLAVMNKRYDMVSVLLPKMQRLIDRKENGNLSAREIAENNQDHVMVNLLIKSSN